jgi:hypothetical protein
MWHTLRGQYTTIIMFWPDDDAPDGRRPIKHIRSYQMIQRALVKDSVIHLELTNDAHTRLVTIRHMNVIRRISIPA